MAGLDIKKMDTPTRRYVKPLAQTDSCQAPHLLYVLSGHVGSRRRACPDPSPEPTVSVLAHGAGTL
jgi:hypothetical protein